MNFQLSLEKFVSKLSEKGIKIVSLADTIASASPEKITVLFSQIQKQFPFLELGIHLHTQSINAYEKVRAAVEAGCRRIDGALLGFGGCPMAKDELIGNMPTEEIIRYLDDNQLPVQINREALKECIALAKAVFQ